MTYRTWIAFAFYRLTSARIRLYDARKLPWGGIATLRYPKQMVSIARLAP